MPGISFSGEPKRGPFWWQIITQQKIQTCREPRKRPLQIHDTLKMYWKMRVPAENKPIHFIGEAKIMAIRTVEYADFAYLQSFARIDGFVDSKELRSWFGIPQFCGDDVYRVIFWGGTLRLSEEAVKIIAKCKGHPDYPEYSAYLETYGVK